METASQAPSVTTEVTADDLFRFSWYHLCHQPGQRARLWACCLIAAGSIVCSLSCQLPTPMLFLVGVAVVCAAPFLYRWQLRWEARHAVRTAPENYSAGSLQLLPECIHEQSALGVVSLAWTAIRRIVVTPGAIYLYRGPSSALIVPRRCFTSPEAADAFIAAAERFHAAAISAPNATQAGVHSGTRQ